MNKKLHLILALALGLVGILGCSAEPPDPPEPVAEESSETAESSEVFSESFESGSVDVASEASAQELPEDEVAADNGDQE